MVVGVMSPTTGATIFERFGNGFQKRGRDISSYDGGIALNYDGSIVTVGEYSWPSRAHIGRAAVFQWKDNNEDGSMQWMQMGSDITGDASYDSLGDNGCVSITYDGYPLLTSQLTDLLWPLAMMDLTG